MQLHFCFCFSSFPRHLNRWKVAGCFDSSSPSSLLRCRFCRVCRFYLWATWWCSPPRPHLPTRVTRSAAASFRPGPLHWFRRERSREAARGPCPRSPRSRPRLASACVRGTHLGERNGQSGPSVTRHPSLLTDTQARDDGEGDEG